MKTIFLDRDGVLNEDTSYPHKWESFKIIEGVVEALKLLTMKKFNFIIITNQSGIAKNFFTEDEYNILKKKFINFFLEKDIKFLDVLHCPHHPLGVLKKYRKNCFCRKPNPGLIEIAKRKYNIDENISYMIGDKITDMQAGKAAGVKNNFLIRSMENEKLHHDFKVFENLLECAEYIINTD